VGTCGKELVGVGMGLGMGLVWGWHRAGMEFVGVGKDSVGMLYGGGKVLAGAGMDLVWNW
jgi:hypothetical protein